MASDDHKSSFYLRQKVSDLGRRMDSWPDRCLQFQYAITFMLLASLRVCHNGPDLATPVEDPFAILFPCFLVVKAVEHTPHVSRCHTNLYLDSTPCTSKTRKRVLRTSTIANHLSQAHLPQECNLFCDSSFIFCNALLAPHLCYHISALEQVLRQFIS